MKIHSINIPHGLCLAPLAGVSDRAFRVISKDHGAEYMCSEMVSAAAICYGDKKTPKLCEFGDDEMPLALQLFGSRPDFVSEAARRISDGSLADYVKIPAAIDINMGCPVRKIVSNGEGSALMRDIPLAAKIVSETVKAVNLPVTVKIRAGFDEENKNAPEMAKALEAAGAAMICVHGRTRSQMYSGKADLKVIAAVKNAVKIPVVGNGDIFSAEAAKTMFSETGCDGIMIARGAMGNPWIFDELTAFFDGEPYTPPTINEIVGQAMYHLDLMCEFKDEQFAIPEARKIISYYIHDIPGAASVRGLLNQATSKDFMKEVLYTLTI
ncbi:MAG: tRNA dihydrouridine synthase DusB [Clostridia bacterium]|nr:tRNA dihydrouridine synthase DusB [Clostridia bacterium]